MNSFSDFVSWAGTQRAAGEMLGLSDSMVSLILKGDRALLPDHAIAAERASGGLYRADDMLPGIEFIRDPSGAIASYCIRVDAKKEVEAGQVNTHSRG